MIVRDFWLQRLQHLWDHAPIAWLAGVRRVGKTTLARSLPPADTLFLNCDLARAAQAVADPEFFFSQVRQPVVVFDEIHQLPDPTRLLKIAADEFPKLKVVATGSSTLAAARKFRDALTGRKRLVCLRPVLFSELSAFGNPPIEHRLLRGGLPSVLLADRADPEFYSEWLDSHFARDVQELFGVAKRTGYLTLLQILLRQSGGLLDLTRLARDTGLSRPDPSARAESDRGGPGVGLVPGTFCRRSAAAKVVDMASSRLIRSTSRQRLPDACCGSSPARSPLHPQGTGRL